MPQRKPAEHVRTQIAYLIRRVTRSGMINVLFNIYEYLLLRLFK